MVVTRVGGPEVLELRDVPEPQPKAGEVLVRVEAVGINFADTHATRGSYPGTPEPPWITGREFAGVLEATGERVMGYTQYGAAAEKIAVAKRHDLAAAGAVDVGAIRGVSGDLPYRLPGVLEGRVDAGRQRTSAS